MEGDIMNIGAGLAIGLGAIGPAIGIGMLAAKAMEVTIVKLFSLSHRIPHELYPRCVKTLESV